VFFVAFVVQFWLRPKPRYAFSATFQIEVVSSCIVPARWFKVKRRKNKRRFWAKKSCDKMIEFFSNHFA